MVICFSPARTCGLTRTIGRLPVRVSLGSSVLNDSQIFSIVCGDMRMKRPRSRVLDAGGDLVLQRRIERQHV